MPFTYANLLHRTIPPDLRGVIASPFILHGFTYITFVNRGPLADAAHECPLIIREGRSFYISPYKLRISLLDHELPSVLPQIVVILLRHSPLVAGFKVYDSNMRPMRSRFHNQYQITLYLNHDFVEMAPNPVLTSALVADLETTLTAYRKFNLGPMHFGGITPPRRSGSDINIGRFVSGRYDNTCSLINMQFAYIAESELQTDPEIRVSFDTIFMRWIARFPRGVELQPPPLSSSIRNFILLLCDVQNDIWSRAISLKSSVCPPSFQSYFTKVRFLECENLRLISEEHASVLLGFLEDFYQRFHTPLATQNSHRAHITMCRRIYPPQPTHHLHDDSASGCAQRIIAFAANMTVDDEIITYRIRAAIDELNAWLFVVKLYSCMPVIRFHHSAVHNPSCLI